MADFPEKVLVVDDQETLLEIIEKTLKMAGDIDVRLCDGMDKAMEQVKDFTPELVILDLMMPSFDGTDVIRALRDNETTINTPIIFVTGATDVKMVDEYEKLGVIGVIYKPFLPTELLNKLRQIWEDYSNASKA